MLLPLGIFIIAFLALLWSGKILPQALATISRTLHLSQFVTAFLLASFATSAPELFVGISSAVQGVSDLSLASIIGSNIANITIVVGLAIIVAGSVSTEGKISSRNYWLISLIAFLPLLLLFDGLLSRIDGVILLIAFGLYIGKLFRDKEHFSKTFDGVEDKPSARTLWGAFRALGRFSVAMGVLLVSSFALVWASQSIVATYFNNDFVLFGAIVIALGTSLPELVFGIRAVLDDYDAAMVGNALGSVAFNAAGIVGIVALIRPIETNFSESYLVPALFLLFAFGLFHLFAYTKNRMAREEGILLVALYVLFLVVII